MQFSVKGTTEKYVDVLVYRRWGKMHILCSAKSMDCLSSKKGPAACSGFRI